MNIHMLVQLAMVFPYYTPFLLGRCTLSSSLLSSPFPSSDVSTLQFHCFFGQEGATHHLRTQRQSKHSLHSPTLDGYPSHTPLRFKKHLSPVSFLLPQKFIGTAHQYHDRAISNDLHVHMTLQYHKLSLTRPCSS